MQNKNDQINNAFKEKRMKDLQRYNTYDEIYSCYSLTERHDSYCLENGLYSETEIYTDSLLDEGQQFIDDRMYKKPGRVFKVGEYRYIPNE